MKGFVLNFFRKRFQNGIKHHSATIDGSRIHWVEAGDSNKPTLLCIDGWMCSWEAFKRIIPHLKKQYRLIIVDIPGFGKSEPLSTRHTAHIIKNTYNFRLGQFFTGSFTKTVLCTDPICP